MLLLILLYDETLVEKDWGDNFGVLFSPKLIRTHVMDSFLFLALLRVPNITCWNEKKRDLE